MTTLHPENNPDRESLTNDGHILMLDALSLYGRTTLLQDVDALDEVRSQLDADMAHSLEAGVALAERVSSVDDIADLIIDSCWQAAEIGEDSYDADSVGANMAIEAMIGRCIGRDVSGNENPTDYADARKQLFRSVIDRISDIRRTETNPQKPQTAAVCGFFEGAYLSQHPSILDYHGGLAADVEVAAALTRVPELRSVYGRKLGSMTYDLAFIDDHEPFIQALLDHRSTREQLETLRVLKDTVRYMRHEGYASDDVPRLADTLWQYESGMNSWLPRRMATEVVNVARFGYDDDLQEDAERVLDWDRAETEGMVFTGDYAKLQPTLIAPGLVGARSRYGIIEAAAQTGETNQLEAVDLQEVLTREGIEASEEDTALFQELHTPAIQGYLEVNLGGVRLNELSLPSQFRLLNYLGTRDAKDFDHVCKVSESLALDKSAQQRFLEAFLATEFGDDFGDTIVAVVEHTTPEQSDEVFDIIDTYRTFTPDMARWFGGFDPELQSAIERAMNERLSEAMSLVETVAVNGPQVIDTAPHSTHPDYVNDGRFEVRYGTVDDVLEGMKIHRDSLALAHAILSDSETRVSTTVDGDKGFQIYRFSSLNHGEALLHVRREGSSTYDKGLEYGSRSGVEATVSLVVNPSRPFHLSVEKDPEGVSVFRLDREGRTVDEAPDSPDRTPVREDGLVSYDASSIMGRPDSNAVKAGRVFAAGNITRSHKLGIVPSLHHNTNYFDQAKYGMAKGFARISDFAAASAEALIANQLPESRAELRRRMAIAAVRAGRQVKEAA